MFTSLENEFVKNCKTLYSQGPHFGVNSGDTRDVKIKSLQIISYVKIIVQERTNRESKKS